ncbi:MAG: phosphoribosyltransferase family protein [Candidatus Berkelbacteria bacterium]|nr:phosphoribosyltransferase family protein [Candidatus Berkelbacteria bacterium]
MFEDRSDAGKKLAQALLKYKGKDLIVLAIPRGGVPVGYEVAKKLKCPFHLVIVRKLPMPDNPEAGIGAVSETDEVIWHSAALEYSEKIRAEILSEQKEEVKRRIKKLRKGRELPDLEDKIVILVDDGLAMGSTMQAAIKTVKAKKAAKTVGAVPIAGREVLRIMREKADEVICLETPVFFQAVAQGYRNWYDLDDNEVIKIMESAS